MRLEIVEEQHELIASSLVTDELRVVRNPRMLGRIEAPMFVSAPLCTVGIFFDALQGRRDKALRAAEVFHSEPDILQVSFQFWKSDDTIEMGFSGSLTVGAMRILRRSGIQRVDQSGAISVTVAC